MTGWVLLARLVRPQGRKGEIIADIFTDFPNRFKTQPRVFLGSGLADQPRDARPAKPPREAIIERHWLHQGRIVFKFQGIDSINHADTLRGLDVVIPPEERVPLEDDAVYIGDLVGCQVIDLTAAPGTVVGEVLDVERGLGGAPDLLIVRPATPERLAEPAVESAGRAEHAERSRRGKRAKRLPELLIPFVKKYLVSVDIANKRLEMRLPAGLADLNADTAEVEGEAD